MKQKQRANPCVREEKTDPCYIPLEVVILLLAP